MLGDVSPQTIRLTAQAVVYPGRDHVVRVTIEKASGRRYVQADITAVTRAVLVFLGTDPVIAYDSLVDPVFTFGTGGVLEIDLSDYAMPASILSSHLILFDAEHPSGQVIVDDTDVELVFDFRNVSTTGTTPPPSVEYVTEAPLDGGLYGRQDGGWVSIADVVAGVASVNGQTGIVVLDADDVNAEWALTPGANIAIDRTDPQAPIISAAGSSVNAEYRWLTAAQVGNPGSGRIGVNNDTPSAATAVYVSTTTADGVDITGTLAGVREGDAVFIREKTDSTTWVRYNIAGPITVNAGWATATVEFVAGGGSEPSNNTPVLVALSFMSDSGFITQDEADARYERGLTAGANITIDRTDPDNPVISATGGGGGGAVDSVNGQTGVVVLDAADVGADAAGTAAAEAEDARFQSTGLISGGVLSINADTTKFDVSAVTAVFVDYTDPTKSVATVSTFGPFTAVTVPNLASALVSYVGINSSGTLVQQTTKFTNEQRRSIVSLGAVIHSNNINLNAVNTLVAPVRQLLNQFGDGIRAIGQLNLSGNVYAPLGATLQIQRSAGELFSPGANFHNNPNDPHAAVLGAASPVTFRYRLANSTEYADRDTINPANYDNAGVLTAVPANRYTVQLIALFQSGITRIQYGQTLYNTMSDAVAAAKANGMALEPNIAENGVIRGYIAIKGDATDLTNATQAVFITLSKFSATASVSPITIATTDELAEGGTNLYFTVTRVRQTLLTGLSVATNAVIAATDTVLDALGKLQAQITSHFGVGGSTHPNATTSVAGFMSGADKTKLDGIAAGATANSSDAFLLARANHTGTQASTTISDFDAASRAQTEAMLVAGTNITLTPGGSGATRTLTIDAAGGGGGVSLPVVQALSSTRDLALADINTFNVNSTVNDYTVTIPLQATVAWTADAEIHFLRSNTGLITITAAAGVLLNGVDGASVSMQVQNGAVTIKRIAPDSWWLGGLSEDTKLDIADPRVCTAWVTFNGSGTVSILDSYNVNSVTDNGTGDYTVNFTVAMDNINYAVAGFARTSGSNGAALAGSDSHPPTTAGCRVWTTSLGNAATARSDATYAHVIFFGGKA